MAKRKKKENKRRLLLLILLLICALVLLGGATYAWFTANTKVAIEPLDLEVTVNNGIEISADAKNWGVKLTQDDLYAAAGLTYAGQRSKAEDAGSVNTFPEKLKHVSSVGNINDENRLELFNGVASSVCYKEVDDEGNGTGPLYGVESDDFSSSQGAISLNDCRTDPVLGLVAASEYKEGNVACGKRSGTSCSTPNGNGVVAFDVYFKLENKSTVSLAPGTYVKNDTVVDYGLKNTIRVAFVTLGTQPADYYNAAINQLDENGKYNPTTMLDEFQEYHDKFGGYGSYYGARNMNSFGNIVIWEPNAVDHKKGGIDNAKDNYLMEEENVKDQKLATYGIHSLIDIELPMPLSKTHETVANFAEQTGITTPDTTYKNKIDFFDSSMEEPENHVLFSAVAGVTKMRIYIWVEGQDIDTENNATASKILASLAFTTALTSPEGPADTSLIKYEKVSIENNWRAGTPEAVKTPLKGTAGTETSTETETLEP